MPPIKRPNQRVRTKSTDSVRVIELRKERSRDAARNRRGKENLQFDELAKLLPLPEAITSQLDKASIVRLTISYLNMKEFSGVAPRQGTLDSNSSVASISSLPSDCSHSPLSDHDFDSGSPSGDVNDHDSLALTVYKKRTPLSEVFESDTGIHMLQALDGFLLVVSEDGKFLYVSETVSVHLGLSQVELTGNNMYNYVHPEDHEDLNDVLTSGYSAAKPVSSPVRDIPLFGKGPLSPDPEQEGYPKKKPVSFFVRMKCTLVRRGGSYTKSTGFKVIHCIGRMREYRNDNGMSKFGLVCIGQPLPQLTINELPLECNMFVSRVGMDLKIVYCEGRIHKFMDYYAKDIVGISAYDFYHMGDVSLVQDAHLKFLSKGQVITKYYRWMNKNGGWVWMQTKASLIPHPDNPDIKQMLCLNYIVSNVEHRGVVLGMTQLKDKPMLPSATITELDPSIENDNGDLVDASIQDNCVVFPKWQKCQGNELFARQSNADTYPLGFGSPNSGGAFNLDNEVFTQWQGSDKQSDFEDNLEDVQDLIDSEMTDFDHDLANYVVNGSEMPFTLRPPDEDLTEDFLASNLYPDSNISNSNVPGNVYGTPSGSAQFPNYVNQSTVPQRKRMATENVLDPNSLSFDNNGMYCAAPRSSTQKDCSVIPSKVPRLNHISSVPTATITTPVQQPITGTAEVIVPVSTQGLTQSNVPSYQMVGSSRYQQNNGFVTTKDFQGVVCRGPNQISGVSQGLAAPQVPPGTNGGTPRTEELMVNLVDEMLTDPHLHITNDFQKQNNFNNQESSYVSQKQFKSTVYPMLETKIKQEVKSPTVSEANFFGPVVNRGNFQATQNSITQANRPTVVNNANLQSYSQVTEPTHPPRVNQPLNCTLPQNICSPSMHSSSVFPNQNSAKRNHNFAPPTGVVNSSQNTEFVSPRMNGELEQLKLRAILEQGNMPLPTNLNGRQQQYPFRPNVQQSYTTLSTQNSMAPQRKPGVDPMQNVMHQAGFSVQNLPPGPYPGSQLNTFQQLNNSGSPNVNKTRQNINFPDIKLQ